MIDGGEVAAPKIPPGEPAYRVVYSLTLGESKSLAFWANSTAA